MGADTVARDAAGGVEGSSVSAGRFALGGLVLLATLVSWWLIFDVGVVRESAQVIAAIVTLVACVVVVRRLIGRHGWW